MCNNGGLFHIQFEVVVTAVLILSFCVQTGLHVFIYEEV
jgi:hypothetical protein